MLVLQPALVVPRRCSSLRGCPPARPSHVCGAAKKTGFGNESSGTLKNQGLKVGKNATRERGLRGRGEDETKGVSSDARVSGPLPEGWSQIATMAELDAKNPLPIILKSGKAICLWQQNGMVYCTDCNSTAFQYPLQDSRIFEGPKGVAIEVKLDGTQYDLATGEVLKWCPRDNPVRSFLGMLKANVAQIPLPVYPVRITKEDGIYTTLMKQ